MPLRSIPVPPPLGRPEFDSWSRDLTAVVNNFMQGALTNVTLAANATTTTVTDARISVNSVLAWMPTTATAATAMTTVYVSAINNGTATLTHDSTADTDRTFTVAIIG